MLGAAVLVGGLAGLVGLLGARLAGGELVLAGELVRPALPAESELVCRCPQAVSVISTTLMTAAIATVCLRLSTCENSPYCRPTRTPTGPDYRAASEPPTSRAGPAGRDCPAEQGLPRELPGRRGQRKAAPVA